MTPAVSIIIACCNSEGLLQDALSSLRNQTLKNIEIIIINDSPQDINDDKYILYNKEFDNRIIYKRNNQNIGTGMCREIGVNLAHGEYIGFLDADDIALPNAFEILFNAAVENNADIAVANCQVFDTRDISKLNIREDPYRTITVDGCRLYELQLKRINMPYYLRVDWCNKIYKKSLFVDNKISFPKVVRHEGFMSTVMSLLADRAVIINKTLFLVYKSINSVSKKFKERNIQDTITSTIHIMYWLKKINYLNKYYYDFINFSFYVIFNLNLKNILKIENNEIILHRFLKSLLHKNVFPHFNKYLMFRHRIVEQDIFLYLISNKNRDSFFKIYDTDYFYRTEFYNYKNKRYDKPTISIVTITKNILKQGREQYIRKAIDSVKNQSYGYEYIEHLVIDGASTDGSTNFLMELTRQGNITRLISESDSGIYNAMNKGLLYSSGDYILFLNSDDYLDCRCIEALVSSCLKEHSDYAFCNASIVDKFGKSVGSHIGNINKIFFGTPYCHQALLCSKNCFTNIKFNENYKLTMWPFALDLYNSGYKFSYINEKLSYFRSGGLSASQLFISEQYIIKQTIASRLCLNIDEYEQLNNLVRRKSIQDYHYVLHNINKIYSLNTDFSNDFYSKLYNLISINKQYNSFYNKLLQSMHAPNL